MKSLGEKVKRLRMSVGLSQEQLAQMLDVSLKSVRRYETGKSRPDTHSLILLATFFDVSSDYLLGLVGLKTQSREEENKLLKQGIYNPLYKSYLACKKQTTIDESATYYWIYYGDNDAIGGQTEWVGWTDETKMMEIRRLRPVIPQTAINMCESVYGRPLLLNTQADAAIFRIYGGHAIVKADICKTYLPEFYEDYIGPNPEHSMLK